MLTLQWTIEGEQQLSRRLRGLSAEMGDWTPAFRQSAADLKDLFEGEVFDTQGAAIQERWSPLSRAYASRKARRFGNKGILEATGEMRKSFKSKFDAGSATIWNSVSYFKYHQSNQPRVKIPRRVMMKLGHQQREMVVKIFHTHAIKKLKRT